MAVALAATTLAGAAFAADMTMPLKAPPPVVAPFFLVNDTSVSFTWYPNATDPGVCAGNTGNFPVAGANNKDGFCQGSSNGFSKYQGSVTHFDVWGYGTNFFNVDYIKSDGHDPIGGVAGAAGSAEVYAFGRSTLSGNALTSSKWFSSWFFKDIGLEFGGDANTENNQLSPEVRKLDLGLAFTFNLPGTVVLGVLAQKEWNHNSFLSCGVQGSVGTFACNGPAGLQFNGDREFHWAPRLELALSEPLSFLPWPITWNGFTGVTFPKGTGVSTANLAAAGTGLTPWNVGTAVTKTEVFEDNRLVLDISKVWWGKAGIWDGYVGWRYWYNKFGTNHNTGDFANSGCNQVGTLGCAPGSSIESTVYIGTTYHFK
jgi:hypothetical protein